MDELIKKARGTLAAAETQLAFAKGQVERLERNCIHDWTETKYDPIRHESYTIPGDTPGTMGVDWRGPTYVPSKTEDRWTRDCKKCGKHQETKQAQEKQRIDKTPIF